MIVAARLIATRQCGDRNCPGNVPHCLSSHTHSTADCIPSHDKDPKYCWLPQSHLNRGSAQSLPSLEGRMESEHHLALRVPMGQLDGSLTAEAILGGLMLLVRVPANLHRVGS